MKPLTVLSVAYPLAPVGADSVGGAEQILAAIDSALVAAGHRSLVIAREGSEISGQLIPIPACAGVLDEDAKRRAHQDTRAAIERALRGFNPDLVHMHGVDFYEYLPPPGVPVLVTLHLPPEWYPPEVLHPSRPRTYLHCVSAAQRRRCPRQARLLPDIPNGVAVHAGSSTKQNYALALGRICPEKGFHLALDAGTAAGVPVYIAGQVYAYEAHQNYFDRELAPRLSQDGHRFLGPVGREHKRELLTEARCVLVPSLVAETSSLVAMEALAAGTPVVAFECGALPEIVEHGRTGFIVHDVNGMAEAIRQIDQIDSAECRRVARENFSLERMIARYFHVYEQLALEPHWEALFERCPWATPFQHPAWVLGWWRNFGGERWSTVTTWRDGRLAGLAPLFEWEGRHVFIGSGVTDYNDVLAEPGAELNLPSPVELTDLPPHSPLLGHFKGERGSPCPVARLRPAPPKLQKNLRYSLRRLQCLGDVRIERATAETLDPVLDALFRWHTARWQTRGQSGVLDDGQIQAFHREIAPAFLAAGMLRLYGLRINGELRGALYCFARNGRVYYYVSGYDPELASCSPGSLMIWHAWEEARAAGDHEFDFLRGSEPYKYAWGAEDRWTMKVVR
ncbi:MAG TPA: GNAT family N-acetyltransferase [Bryobacteraceae bacterium]|nr:GNAT family N-acetyltransferase [Bryobacteraceae bacterium]